MNDCSSIPAGGLARIWGKPNGKTSNPLVDLPVRTVDGLFRNGVEVNPLAVTSHRHLKQHINLRGRDFRRVLKKEKICHNWEASLVFGMLIAPFLVINKNTVAQCLSVPQNAANTIYGPTKLLPKACCVVQAMSRVQLQFQWKEHIHTPCHFIGVWTRPLNSMNISGTVFS